MYIVKDSSTTEENLESLIKAIEESLPDCIDTVKKKEARAALKEIEHVKNETAYLLARLKEKKSK